MAEAVTTEFAKMCLEKPISGAISEVQFALQIKSRIKSLERITKPAIEAYLQEADAANLTSDAQLLAIEQLSCALEMLRDLSDMRAARAMQKQSMSTSPFKKVLWFLSPSSNPILCAFRDAKKLKDFIEDVDSIARVHTMSNSMLRLPAETKRSQRQAPCRKTGPMSSEEVIGRDEDRENIIRMLFQPSSGWETFSVVPIVGIGGMGKTTVAQYVFNDERVQNHFDIRLWVDVPQDLDFEEVVRTMLLEHATSENHLLENKKLAQLQRSFHSLIYAKKYLLVLDNVWDHEDLGSNWRELSKLLGFGGAGSMVLATTRSAKVAETIGTVDPYRLSGLTADDSWRLFQRHAFTQGHQPDLEAIGKEIAHNCRNVPLVIHSVGCLLQKKHTITVWEDFRDKLGSLCYYEEVPWVLQTLKLSYDELNLRLKLCFAYCSLFPNLILEAELVALWISLGYVYTPSGSQSLVDIANDYVIRLKEKGLLVDIWQHSEVIEMHDVIHDLACSVAGAKYKRVDSESREFDERIRHVSFSKGAELSGNFPSPSLLKMKEQLQSILLVSRIGRKLKLKGLSEFKCLRVLGLAWAGLEKVPKSIGKLIHLRYLDLSYNDLIRKLPNSITELVNLVFLKLRGCTGLKELPRNMKKLRKLIGLELSFCSKLRNLPNGISKLTSLEYFYLEGCLSLQELPRDMSKLARIRKLCLNGCPNLRHLPLGLENMTDLRTLDLFVARKRSSNSANPNNPNESNDDEVGRLAALNPLNNLEGQLGIVVDGNCSLLEAEAANLKGKRKLTGLRIDFCGGPNRAGEEMLEGFQPHTNLRKLWIRSYKGERLPSWIDNLTNLKEIRINNWEACQCVGSFGRLPHLKALTIENSRNLEYIESTSSDNTMNADADIDPSAAPLFPELEALNLRSLPKLKGWRRMCRSGSNNHGENILLGAGARAFPRLKRLQLDDVGVVHEEFRGLSSLESLVIMKCGHWKEVPDVIDTLTSLKMLEIGDCPNLTSISKRTFQLSNLESLDIHNCLSLKERLTTEDWPPIPRFPKLKRLFLRGLGMEFVPELFQGLSSLEWLWIDDCQKLQEMPEWIDTLTSLKFLEVRKCPKVSKLPKQKANLANLKRLWLRERCQKPIGED